MDGIVVKRYYGGGNGGDDRCRLTVLSPVDLSPKVACVNLSLPSYIDDEYIRSGCGGCGLLSFNGGEGNIVLCNLATRQLKRLPPPPKSKPRLELFATGLGHDSKSDDFKVIRFLRQPYYEGGRFRDYNERCELYSLKSGVWKDILIPDGVFVNPDCGVYVGGRCYWSADLGFSLGGSSTDYGSDIVSFDFTTESFHCLHSPPLSSNTVFDLVEYRGSLGAIGFSRPGDATRGFGFEFWVREECSWTKVFDVVLSNVERVPLGLIDGRFLFLERKCRSNELLYQLVVYDRITKEWKELDIYDYHKHIEVSFYVEGQVALPDAMPMQRYDSKMLVLCLVYLSCLNLMLVTLIRSYTHEEEKQIKKRRRERLFFMSMSRAKLLLSDDDDSCEDEEDDDGSGESCKSTDDEDEDDYRSGDSSGESCKGTDDDDEDEDDDDMIDDDDDDTSMIIDDDDDYDDDDDD